jgi:hypothetical protein
MKTKKLNFNKVSNPATYEQISKLSEYENVSWNVSRSQLMKRLDAEECEELIELAKSGEEIKIID